MIYPRNMKQMTSQEKKALFRALLRLFAHWDLTNEQSSALIGVSRDSWERIRSGVYDEHITDDLAQRAGALIGIHGALRTIFPKPRCYDWIKRPNHGPLFACKSALDFMVNGGLPAIHSVREYLQAEVAR